MAGRGIVFKAYLPACLPRFCRRAAASDHHERLLAAEQERKLIDHRLHDILQIRAQLLEVAHVVELDLDQRRPPADRQILAVHAVQLRVLGDAATPNRINDSRVSVFFFGYKLSIDLPHKVPEHVLENGEIDWWQFAEQRAESEQTTAAVVFRLHVARG